MSRQNSANFLLLLAAGWDESWGDRSTKIVFIGIEMDKEQIVQALDDCLLTGEEMNADWRQFRDTLPAIQTDEI
ncbi:GTP-binding protein [Paenibacillus thermotolerans]|uniref:GTP-binding protein n=1 Tax=Paenibacillus thermotolerans TaxID=3027807 RepID=UPI00236832AE|nr:MULTISPECIES: GTP-binding protein [unclassified Paenibacillus]